MGFVGFGTVADLSMTNLQNRFCFAIANACQFGLLTLRRLVHHRALTPGKKVGIAHTQAHTHRIFFCVWLLIFPVGFGAFMNEIG